MHKGLDIGTNMLVSAYLNPEGHVEFKKQRDAYYRIIPKSDVNKNSIKLSLEKRGSNFLTDVDGSFIVIGEDALEMAIERNDVAKRPLSVGVISPKTKDSLPILKIIIESLINKSDIESDTIFYSVPAAPIDLSFDVIYHTEILGMYIRELGFKSSALNEAYAIAISELIDEGLTGIALSFGSGLVNVVVVHEGDPLIEFSLTRAGDYIDNAVAKALDISPSLVQLEKESGTDLLQPKNKIVEAVSVYYKSVIDYTLKNISYELYNRQKQLPTFRSNIPIVVAGGLTLAGGFVDKVKESIGNIKFPFEVGEVKLATNPLFTVANGCLLASQL